MYEYLFYALSYNPGLLCLFCGSDGSSFGRWELIHLDPALLVHSRRGDFYFVFNTSSLSGDAPGSPSTFPTQSQNRPLPH